jgi:thymidylate synthase
LVGSLHAYDQNAQNLDAFIAEGWQATTLTMPEMPPGDPWAGVAYLLDIERKIRSGIPPGSVDFGSQPYWADLGRLLGVYAVRDGPREAIEDIRRAMNSGYYNSYITDRINEIG